MECNQKIYDRCFFKTHSRLINFGISFSTYENDFLRKVVILGKNSAPTILEDLAYFISEEIKSLDVRDYYLTPVPITKSKLLSRGYNQAEVLAKKISSLLGLKIFNELIKVKETKDQSVLSYEKRKTNLRDAFSIKSKPPPKVILVDDIKTTGSTLKECAQILRKSGSQTILALTILR